MGNTIYHYCSLDSFFKIITNKTIRLTNAFKTNDSNEINWILRLMELEFSKSNEININNLVTAYDYWAKNYFKPHIACFSKSGDLLSQWRAYANDAKGIAIGFDLDYFDSIKDTENKEFVIREVIYNEIEQRRTIKRDFNLESLYTAYKSVDLPNTNIDYKSIILMEKIFKYGMVFKNDSFNQEKEVRLIHGFNEVAAEPDVFEFRVTDDDLISYIELRLNPKHEVPPINEIILGPRCKAEPGHIRLFLERHFYCSNIAIYKSKSTYR